MVRVDVQPSEAEVVCSADGKYSLSFNLSVNLPVEGLIDQLLSLSSSHRPPEPVACDPFLQTPFSALRSEDAAYRDYLARGRWPGGDFFVETKSRSASAASTAFTARPAVSQRGRAMSEASCLPPAPEKFPTPNFPTSDTRGRALTMNHWAPPEISEQFPISNPSECKQM